MADALFFMFKKKLSAPKTQLFFVSLQCYGKI